MPSHTFNIKVYYENGFSQWIEDPRISPFQQQSQRRQRATGGWICHLWMVALGLSKMGWQSTANMNL